MNHWRLLSCLLIWTLWCNPIHPLCSDRKPISSSSTTPRKPSTSVGMKSSWFCRTKSIDSADVTENSDMIFPHVTSVLNRILPKVVNSTAVSSAFSKLLLSVELVSCRATFVYVLRCIVSSTVAAYKFAINICSVRSQLDKYSHDDDESSPLSAQWKLLEYQRRSAYFAASSVIQSSSYCAARLPIVSVEIECRASQGTLPAIWEYLLMALASSPLLSIIF